MKYLLMRLALCGAALAGMLGVPYVASAQSGVPSYAIGADESLKGTVAGFDGKYNLRVRDARGFVDNIRLHDGTIINPTGLRLAAGQSVTIYGRSDGSYFAANEIDTPYHQISAYGYAYPVAPYPYYGAPLYGPYPYYGYGPFYGPRFGIGFRFR